MNDLFEIVRREAAERGVLSFARFMELALYCPVHGYYETKKDNLGRRGDFYTSVSVGPLFGQMLAFQFAEWLEDARIADCRLRIVEAGAHDGRLAGDILTWLESHRPALYGRIEYWIIEPSARRQDWQQERLGKFSSRVRWFNGFDTAAKARPQSAIGSPQGYAIVFSNEVLDAMPVHRLGWDAANKTWFEWGVMAAGKELIWAPMTGALEMSNLPAQIPPLPAELLDALPDGYAIEISPAAQSWWWEATGILERGRLMTIDYGLTGDEIFSPGRTGGTLRAYFHHQVSDDLLANVGEQDLTAHVNFSAIQAIGESAGLTTESFSTQSQFLTQIAGRIWKNPETFDEWDASCTRQFQTLTHPEHLGRAFRMLVQSR